MRIAIAIDTREQRPWHFPEELATVERRTLNAADYALVNDDSFALERKNLDDFIGTVSSGWERFQRELDRMIQAQFPVRVIVVEGTWEQIVNMEHNHPKVRPAFVLKQLAWLTMNGVSVIFAGNARMAAQVGWRLLYERWQQIGNELL